LKMKLAAMAAVGLSAAALVATAPLGAVQAAHPQAKPITLTIETGGDVNVRNLFQDKLDPMFSKMYPNVHFQLLMPETSSASNAISARFFAAIQHHKPAPYDIGTTGMAHHDLVPVSVRNIPNLRRVNMAMVKTQGYGDTVPYRGSSVVIAYNSVFVKHPPRTLPALISWIEAHPGKFTYCPPDAGGSGDAFVQRILSQFIPHAALVKTDNAYDPALEKYWTKGFDELRALGKDMYRQGVYPNGNTPVLNLLANSAIWMAPAWSDMSLQAIAEHELPPTIKLEQITPPLYGGLDFLGVPKNSPHKAMALKFLNFVLSSPAQTVIVDYMNGYPGVRWRFMPPAVRKKFAGIDQSFGQGFFGKMDNDMAAKWQKLVPTS
jgi:putative spermidine/putrescine transport system substrate-binding protein